MPGLGGSIAAVFRLQWKRLIRGRKLRLGAIATALIVLVIVATRYLLDEVDEEDFVLKGIDLGFFNLLIYLLPFLFTSGAIAEEVEGRTFTFVTGRPVSRLAIIVGKYLAGMAMTAILLVAGLLVLHVGAFATDPTPMFEHFPDTLRAGGVLLLLAMLYGALCIFWGSLTTEAAGIVSALYLAIVEFGFGKLPFFLRFVSMNFHAGDLAGLERGGFFPDTVPEMDLWIPAAVLPSMTLVFVLLGWWVVTTSEFRTGKA